MRTDLPLTEKEVKLYQHFYYDVYRPLFKDGFSESEIRSKMKPQLDEVNWNFRLFDEYKSIDSMQRFVFDHAYDLVILGIADKPFTSFPEYRCYDPNYGALRLKDNQKSEDPDIITI